VVLDLYSRIVGWSMGKAITTELACRALDMAWYSRLAAPGLIFHGDRGTSMPAVATRTFSPGMG
jgi:putative transposase